jgi:putative ABC transporter, permease protein
VQYFASFALIIGAGCMYLQNHFMQHAPLGYERDQIIIAEMSDEIRAYPETFMNKIKSYAGVSGITRSERILSSGDSYMTWGREYCGKKINYVVIPVEASFLDVLGIPAIEGRTFRTEDALTRHGAYVFNERAKQEYGLELGTMIDSTQIVGFMPDVKFASFRNAVEPMAFYVWGKENWGNNSRYVYIRMKAGTDMRAAMEHVQSVLKELDPDYPFNVFFFDKVLQQLYEKERAVGSLITLFSAIAIFISMVGVFGLVVFDSEYKRKEIGIRKVFGSSTRQILVRFNRTYFKIVIVCFVVAAPVAYYGVSQWLTNFAYRAPIRWWIFALAFIAVAAITFFTVTFQNWRAANANPVDSLKSE